MLSHRDIIRDVRRALKALPDHPSVCEVTRVPGAGTQTIVVRDASGRPMLTLAAVYAPAVPGREQRTLDAVAPRPELPAVPPLAVDPMAPGFRVLRVGDLVFALDDATGACIVRLREERDVAVAALRDRDATIARLTATVREHVAAERALNVAHEARMETVASDFATPDGIRAAEDAHTRAVLRAQAARAALVALDGGDRG